MTKPGGSFPKRTMETSKGPATQAYNCFMVTKQCDVPFAIHYRTVSCFCDACLGGELVGCSSLGHVPAWKHKAIQQKPFDPIITRTKNTTTIAKLISKLIQFKDTLTFYFCLGWVENVQQPSILCMSNLKLNGNTVRCHLLSPYKASLNNFSWTTVAKPNQLCHKLHTECDCQFSHAINFPLNCILEVAVQKSGHTFNSLFSKCLTLENCVPDSKLYQLNTTTQAGITCFNNYATKRLEYYNDFFLLEELEPLL
jgi:hypothetical protein